MSLVILQKSGILGRMEMIWPTVLVLLGTALIGWGLFALIAYLERISGGGHGHSTKNKETPEQ